MKDISYVLWLRKEMTVLRSLTANKDQSEKSIIRKAGSLGRGDQTKVTAALQQLLNL